MDLHVFINLFLNFKYLILIRFHNIAYISLFLRTKFPVKPNIRPVYWHSFYFNKHKNIMTVGGIKCIY